MPKIEYVDTYSFRRRIFFYAIVELFRLLKSVRSTLVPIVWFDDEATLTPDIHSEMTLVIVGYNAATYLKYILIPFGSLIALVASVYIYKQVKLFMIVLRTEDIRIKLNLVAKQSSGSRQFESAVTKFKW